MCILYMSKSLSSWNTHTKHTRHVRTWKIALSTPFTFTYSLGMKVAKLHTNKNNASKAVAEKSRNYIRTYIVYTHSGLRHKHKHTYVLWMFVTVKWQYELASLTVTPPTCVRMRHRPKYSTQHAVRILVPPPTQVHYVRVHVRIRQKLTPENQACAWLRCSFQTESGTAALQTG